MRESHGESMTADGEETEDEYNDDARRSRAPALTLSTGRHVRRQYNSGTQVLSVSSCVPESTQV